MRPYLNICVFGGYVINKPVLYDGERREDGSWERRPVTRYMLGARVRYTRPAVKTRVTKLWVHTFGEMAHILAGRMRKDDHVVVHGALMNTSWKDPTTRRTRFGYYLHSYYTTVLASSVVRRAAVAGYRLVPEAEMVRLEEIARAAGKAEEPPQSLSEVIGTDQVTDELDLGCFSVEDDSFPPS